MMKRFTCATLFMLFAVQLTLAQDAEPTATIAEVTTEEGVNTSIVIMLLATLLVLVFVLLFLSRIFHALRAEFFGAPVKPVSAPVMNWKKISNTLQEAVPVEEEHNVTLDHEYDGIRELDNNLPLWWKYMFYATIVFSVIYIVRYHMISGNSQEDEFKKELAMAEIAKEEYRKKNAANVDESTVTMLDASGIDAGKTIFNENCRACHGGVGEGGVGPNLTDDYWMHGGGIKNIFKSIKYGIPEKGMKSWQAELKPVQIQQLSSYIMSLKGSKPANAKEPQGEIYVDEATPADSLKSDSMKVAVAEVK